MTDTPDDKQGNENPSADGAEIVSFPLPDDSHVLTFDLERASLRGRIVRLGKVLDDMIIPHSYPDKVSSMVAETATLAILLSSMLKYEGVFILQAQGEGPVLRLVADVTSSGDVRATAGYDRAMLEKILEEDPSPEIRRLVSNGYLAFTVDQGEYSERYQGIVELCGQGLTDSIHHYFAQSEQIGTAIKMAVAKGDDGSWRAGAIMLQHIPVSDLIPQDHKPVEDHWDRARILLETCTNEELLDARLHDETLLFRLFHEEGIRVYDPHKIQKGCRCTPEKLQSILGLLSEDDKQHAIQDNKIVMTCEFCNKDFCFNPDEV
ncbi:MAG: Hsp33 family molecular chaperone HslO [Alphaproteobacteria bacterium]|nr:Hsp33 family molecular chaperone HslO [Alphaproteobacteria bacterium]MCB1551429.1 Hsp33 family molecular chaperone HslO [Alphaproteobacteria bacterium]MCB9984446.1 Hsp33 family molecular chaperone HslO [Micavibrio sp.]HPQ50105.1 Hsp33 family molecular chaperone HslO [Alphaproteobacteria bacterium]HRK97789.1 Hsp33 family molecular chaperone HslO [Alphaproteobacteria bacterium]